MKRYIAEFVRRGLLACGFGPIVLAIMYLFLQNQLSIECLSVTEVCTGIFSISALAFVAGGMNVVYQIERIPLSVAILLHGAVLYVSYLLTYLMNGWMQWSTTTIMVFSLIFVFGYLLIWAFIYSVTRKNTKNLNKILSQNRASEEK